MGEFQVIWGHPDTSSWKGILSVKRIEGIEYRTSLSESDQHAHVSTTNSTYRDAVLASNAQSHKTAEAHDVSVSVAGSNQPRNVLPNVRPTASGVMSKVLLVRDVPVYMSAADICLFLAPFYSSIMHLRLLQETHILNRLILLVTFDDPLNASVFASTFSGKRFNSLSEERCQVYEVTALRLVQEEDKARRLEVLEAEMDTGDAGAWILQTSKKRFHPGGMTDSSHTHVPISPLSFNQELANTLKPLMELAAEQNSSLVFRFASDDACHGKHSFGKDRKEIVAEELSEIYPKETDHCPVCLEPLRPGATGGTIVTSLCNHDMHASCLSKWGDNCCPVCRFCHEPSPESDICMMCGSSEPGHLWMCLICGHVGCGRNISSHALLHFEQTNHIFSVNLENGKVWDYAGDNYVYRLVSNKTDGKLIELPLQFEEPESTSSSRINSIQDEHQANNAQLLASSSNGFNGASSSSNPEAHSGVVGNHGMTSSLSVSTAGNLHTFSRRSRRLDQFRAVQYDTKESALYQEYKSLLDAQMESQRSYYENLKTKTVEELESRVQSKRKEVQDLCAMVAQRQTAVDSVNRDIANHEYEIRECNKVLAKETKENEFLRTMGENIRLNLVTYKDRIEAERAIAYQTSDKLNKLHEQVNQLLLNIEACPSVRKKRSTGDADASSSQQPAESTGSNEFRDLEGADIVGVSPAASSRTIKRGANRKRK